MISTIKYIPILNWLPYYSIVNLVNITRFYDYMKIPTKASGSILFSIETEVQFQDVTHRMSFPDLSIPVILVFYNLKPMNLYRPIALYLILSFNNTRFDLHFPFSFILICLLDFLWRFQGPIIWLDLICCHFWSVIQLVSSLISFVSFRRFYLFRKVLEIMLLQFNSLN